MQNSARTSFPFRRLLRSLPPGALACLALLLCPAPGAMAQTAPLVLTRDNSTIVLEPYAPNIIRVTLSLEREAALEPPGYGFVAHGASGGWTHEQVAAGD